MKRFERYLHEPDVGVALDPEWAMMPKQTPGKFYGQTTGATINEVAAYLSGIVAKNDLPEKALVFHQVNSYVVKDEDGDRDRARRRGHQERRRLRPSGSKAKTYAFLMKPMPAGVHPGFKLFFDEDTQNGRELMTPRGGARARRRRRSTSCTSERRRGRSGQPRRAAKGGEVEGGERHLERAVRGVAVGKGEVREVVAGDVDLGEAGAGDVPPADDCATRRARCGSCPSRGSGPGPRVAR